MNQQKAERKLSAFYYGFRYNSAMSSTWIYHTVLRLKSDEYVGQNSFIKVLSREPQLDYPEHCHDFSELVLVSSGSGTHIINGNQSVVLPNTVACVSERDYHQYIDNKDVTLLNILYNKNTLSVSRSVADIIRRLETNNHHFLITDNAFTRLNAIGQQMQQEQQSAEIHSAMMIQLLFDQLMLTLDRLAIDQQQHTPVIQAIIYLCNNFTDQNLSVQLICGMFQVSQKSMSNQLVKMTGLSTNPFINQLRIRKARSLLLQGNSITDVAFRVGYNDSNYFSTKFKNITGQTPRAFLKVQ